MNGLTKQKRKDPKIPLYFLLVNNATVTTTVPTANNPSIAP